MPKVHNDTAVTYHAKETNSVLVLKLIGFKAKSYQSSFQRDHSKGSMSKVQISKVQISKVLPPKTAEEIVARERERKARTTLLMALPEDHLAKFHKMTDAKEMWDAIKSRFGGNDESKKMQKYILKQQC
ncbi:hypothetical protein Tco_1009505 [Tanacetum coccineum]